MLDESMVHYREMLDEATQLMARYFQKPVYFSTVTQLSEPDRRNVVLRLLIDNPTSKMPQTLILKKNAVEKQIFDKGEGETEVDQLTRFAHDWAGIEFLTAIGKDHAPHFYAGSTKHQFILIEDLGLEHPSLVGALARAPSADNVQCAKDALAAYMHRLGKMHADTAGKMKEFTSILKRIYPPTLRFNFIAESDGEIALSQFKKLIGHETEEIIQEIQSIIAFSQENSEFKVLLHGDICPDNVYYQKNEIRFIDFEFSDYGNALVDGNYLRMFMPSCWCAKAIPGPLVSEMESIYREELKKGVPSAIDNEVYYKQQAYACGYWLLRTMRQLHDIDLIEHEWICPSGPVDADSKWEPGKNAFRPRILSRLETFVLCSKTTGHLPQLSQASARLLLYLRNIWPNVKNMDFFPVFKK